MRNVFTGFAALAAVSVATLGAVPAAQAAMIDFGVVALGGTITYTGARLQFSTGLDLDGATLLVSSVGAGDSSGLISGDHVSISPTEIDYGLGAGPLMTDIVKSWTATVGPDAGDLFTETLTTVDSIDRSTRNAITVTLGGTLTGPGFSAQPVSFILSANQAGGPGNVVSAALTNVSVVPEPSTWVMMLLGFAALGYAAVRRSAKDRSALAI
jgi:hypothetical protein